MDYEKEGLLHEMFERQAMATPDNVAIVSADGRKMTYGELNEVTDVLGLNLRLRGVKPGMFIGIYMERCLEYVITYIGILKAGAAYMPIDVSYPVTLLEDIFKDANPGAVITDPSLVQYMPESARNVILCTAGWIEKLREENGKHAVIPPAPKLTLDSLAYTVYSSGTTGKPKGIQCPHRGAVFSYTWRHNTYPYQPDDREACNVFFVWEMLRPLLKGIPLYVIPDSVIYDPRLLCDFLLTNQITRILFTPSLLEAVLDAEGLDIRKSFASVRILLFCGEVVTVGLLERCIRAMPHIQFLNLYSVSEAHDIACSDLTQWYKNEKARIQNQKFCPVGKLLPGVSVVILDENRQPQPVGVAGEIYVAGPTLSVGYLNRPEINAIRFVKRPDTVPAKVGDRLYKTGDWGYILTDGSFEICGRCDSMVKIRGYSIEIQAVETALLELSMVNACVVVVTGEEGEDKYLVAYIVPEGKASKKDVRAALKRHLPFYMIPSYFVFLQNIPILASSGKLDKRALPPIESESNEVEPEGQATTVTEQELVEMWKDVLHLKSIDIQESFFDLGGHSLSATRVLNCINEKFSTTLSVKDLFIRPTVFAMARHIDVLTNRTDAEMSDEDSRAASPPLDLIKEVERHDQAVLSLNMQLRAFWRSQQYGDRWNKSRVLLTGATGFLGAFLLRDLLLLTKTHIFCLVRESPTQCAEERVRATLVHYELLAKDPKRSNTDQQVLEALFKERVTPIKGDVGLIHMGMSEEDFTYMSTEVDFIIHAAASVNLIYPYQALHGPNVLGTQNVIQFACTSKIKPLHYISTDAVFPHGLKDCPEDADMLQYAADLTDGYAQSKWVAEQLVRRACERGLPAAIYRPGNLSGEHQTAAWNPADFTLIFLQGCLQTGTAPQLDWDVEFTPVDFVSKFVVTLTQRMALALSKVYHLTNVAPVKAEWLFEWISSHGYPLKMMPYNKWIQYVNGFRKNGQLQKLIDNMATDENFFSQLSTYKNDNTARVLRILKIDYPEINHKLLSNYFHKLAKKRVFPPIRRNTTLDRPLNNKVAIVTGASSGIGEAIAAHLARAGAKVALAARRVEKLQDLKASIEREGGVAIAVKTDITDKADVAELVRHTEYSLGPVDILVNNAGIMYYTMMKNLKVEEWEQQVDLNCKGVLNCIGACLDGMLKRGSGHIVNMSSNAGRRGFAGLAVYSGTKFFVEGLSQGMRQELAKSGVKVTCIQPGDVKTELLSHTTDTEAKDQFDGSSSTQILEPDDIGRAVLFAVSQPKHSAINEILIEPREAPI